MTWAALLSPFCSSATSTSPCQPSASSVGPRVRRKVQCIPQKAMFVLRLIRSNTHMSGGSLFCNAIVFQCCNDNIFKLTKELENINTWWFYELVCFACETNGQHCGTCCYFKFSDKVYRTHTIVDCYHFQPRVPMLNMCSNISVLFEYQSSLLQYFFKTWGYFFHQIWFSCGQTCWLSEVLTSVLPTSNF